MRADLTTAYSGTALTSRVVTATKVFVAADARSATLTENGRTLRAEILAPAGAKFSTTAARPASAAENQSANITALTAEYSSAGADVRLAILLTPVGDHWPAALPAPALTPLVEWK